MGSGRFDTGTDFRWFPLGVYTLRQSILSPRAPLISIGDGTAAIVRVDWASVCLEYDGGVGNASAQLENGPSGGPFVSFINVAGWTPESVIADVPTPSLFYANRIMNQTSNVWFIGTPFTIWLVGEEPGFATSQISGTVGLSGAWLPT